jgi:hypothetical protein
VSEETRPTEAQRPEGGRKAPCGCDRSYLRVHLRRHNRSAFNGYRLTPSPYSGVVCMNCWHTFRSKAAYVDELPNMTKAEENAWLRPAGAG